VGGLILSPEQRSALETLRRLWPPASYLAGGLAVAAHLGHRTSRDFDVFAPKLDVALTLASTTLLPDVDVVDQAPGTLHLMIGGVPVSLLEYRYILLEPARVGDDRIPIAGLEDLGCMKLSAIAGRGAARDFWDLHAILTAKAWSVAHALDLFRRKYPRVDVGHVVRSLVYFADAEAGPRPPGLTEEHWATVTSDLRRWVKALAWT
jgi:hypothetical protein